MKKKWTIILGSLVVASVVAVIVFLNSDQYSISKYGAVIYNSNGVAEGWVQDEFLDENRVYGSYYFNPECLEDSDERTTETVKEIFSPSTRTYLLTNEEAYREIFSEAAPKVDFEKEMVVLYMFTVHHVRQYKLSKVSVTGSTIEIEIDSESNFFVNAATIGQMRYVVIRLKKQDVDQAVVKVKTSSNNQEQHAVVYPLKVPEGVTSVGEYTGRGYTYTYYIELNDPSVQGASVTIHTAGTYAEQYKINYSSFGNYGNITDKYLGDNMEIYFKRNGQRCAKIRDEFKQGDTRIKIDKEYTLVIGQDTVNESEDLPSAITIYYQTGDVYYIVKFGQFSEIKSIEWLLQFGLDLEP